MKRETTRRAGTAIRRFIRMPIDFKEHFPDVNLAPPSELL